MRLTRTLVTTSLISFQFTHPGKGATRVGNSRGADYRGFQFTHPGKGATCTYLRHSPIDTSFNSRTLGRVRLFELVVIVISLVSIHAPWEGCDCVCVCGFNSRTLGRVRPSCTNRKFQFTHPGKGATRSSGCCSCYPSVSIHAPWEGCDLAGQAADIVPAQFQFTHPGKGATS